MVELNKDILSKILRIYNLGNIKSIKKINTGHVNYNFDLKTNKGNFIIQIIGDEFNKWKRDRLKMQFKLLRFLKDKNFPYECPSPLKNKYGRYLLTLNKHHIWIYKKIEGRLYKHYNLNHFKEISKGLAIYHNYVKNFKCNDKDFFDTDWLFEKYSEMRKIKSKNKLDTLMLKNLDFFENILEKISEIDFTKTKFVLTHSDFSNENLIFKKSKLKGIIDFDNIQLAPAEKDIAIAVKRCNYSTKGFNKKKLNIFLKEYKKYSLLSIDEELIILSLLKDNCSLFWWLYSEMKKESDEKKRYNALLETIKETKKLIKLIRWDLDD
jgi:homoserine kinase type II